jgi:hypothetical protein
VIPRLTLKTAALVGETLGGWGLLEQQVRAGRWTTYPRAEEAKLRVLAEKLGITFRLEGVVPYRRRRPEAPACGEPATLTEI